MFSEKLRDAGQLSDLLRQTGWTVRHIHYVQDLANSRNVDW